jgi:hypothetical protein
MRHLTNLEYERTVSELLGVASSARATFQPDPASDGNRDDFDVIPVDDAINDARYEQYADEAERLVTAAFKDDTLRARIVTCQPAGPVDQACTRAIVSAFGLRAWRRPLATDEVDALVALANAALTDGETFQGAIARVATALLSSAPFLYRMELDPDPMSTTPRALTPYELASRLSYLFWSGMPDDHLFGLAANGTLTRADVLRAEIDRMIDDPRSQWFVEAFGGRWLGAAPAASRQIDPLNLPAAARADWTSTQAAMVGELQRYFAEFLHGDRDLATLMNADFNFVNPGLARLYGFPQAGLTPDLQRVEIATDRRKGLLGLAATSLATATTGTRTSPFHRGRWILDRLLCQPDPGFGGMLDGLAADPASTYRARVQAVSADATCARCHAAPDNLGLGLEELDVTGALRTTYGDGTPVDTRGALPDGTPFTGEAALADLLAKDPRFLACAARQATRYALNRELGPRDEAPLADLVARWKRGVPTMRALLREIVLDDSFRWRRTEVSP